MTEAPELIRKAIRQEAAKSALLIAVAEAVAQLLSDKGDEWNNVPFCEANGIRDLIAELKDASN